MTAGDNNRDDENRLMGEWMKVMLEELERKRGEHDEALAEDSLRRAGDPKKPDAAKSKSPKRK
jgi:hypothetical protein